VASSVADRLRYASMEIRAAWVRSLPAGQAAELADGSQPWWYWRRPEQKEPSRVKRWWLILAGRGWGKTRTGAEWIADKARRHPGARCALIAPTFSDARDTMVEGETGLLAVLRPWELRGGRVETAWNRSLGELFMANGSRFKCFTSERPRQLRGPQHHYLWGDEPSYWQDAARGTARDTTWSNANIGLRLRPRRNWPDKATFRNQACLTTTPRPVPLLKISDAEAEEKPDHAGLLQRPGSVTITRGRTIENVHNLSDDYRREVIDPLVGTTLGRQELDAELLEDIEGALWTQEIINNGRVETAPELHKICVAFDPSGGEGETHDEHGIIVSGSAGERSHPEFYVIADLSVNGTPTQAARRVILAVIEYQADAIVYESNYGGDWIPTVIETTYQQMVEQREIEPRLFSVEDVSASRSKRLRAEPVAALYEQGKDRQVKGKPSPTSRVHHVGVLPILEGQQTTWVPFDSDSPDRLDALVHSIGWLYTTGPSRADVASPAARERRGRRADQPSSRMPVVYGSRSRRGGL
jgi:phage terminase large subunit-like protein